MFIVEIIFKKTEMRIAWPQLRFAQSIKMQLKDQEIKYCSYSAVWCEKGDLWIENEIQYHILCITLMSYHDFMVCGELHLNGLARSSLDELYRVNMLDGMIILHFTFFLAS